MGQDKNTRSRGRLACGRETGGHETVYNLSHVLA